MALNIASEEDCQYIYLKNEAITVTQMPTLNSGENAE